MNIALQKGLFPGGPGRVLARDHTYPHALGFQLRACPSERGPPNSSLAPRGHKAAPNLRAFGLSARLPFSGSLPGPFSTSSLERLQGAPGSLHTDPRGSPSPGQCRWGGHGFSELPVIPEIPTEAHSLCTCRPSRSGSWAQSPRTQGVLEDGAHLESLPPGRRTYKPRSKDPQEGLRSSGGNDGRTCRPVAQDTLPTAAQTCSLPGGYWCGEAHAEDRVWGQEGPRSQGTGHWVLHAPDCIQGSSDAQRWPWAWLFEAPGGARPIFHGHKSSGGGVTAGAAPWEEGRLGPGAWWEAARAQPSPGLWPQPLGHVPPRGPFSAFPGLCPPQALAGERQEDRGQPPQDLGGLPGADEAIYTSGHSPTEQCIFKRFLPK